MLAHFPVGKLAYQLGNRSGPRRRAANVECARLIVTATFAEQTVPVKRAEQRPDRYCTHIDAFPFRAVRRMPYLVQPAQLVVTSRVDMSFGHRDRQRITLPNFCEQGLN